MLRAGIIGAGRIAWGYDQGRWDGVRSVSHASCLERHPETTLVAIFDPIEESRVAFKAGYPRSQNVQVYDNLTEFLAAELDLVVIASPSEHHCDHILRCLDARIPRLLIEKPVVLSAEEFARVSAANAAAPVPPMVTINYFRRFLPQVQALKEYVNKAREAQSLVQVDVTYSRGLDVNGVHQLDLLGHLFDAEVAPDLDWIDERDAVSPSFGVTVQGCQVTVIGLSSLEYHALEMRVTTQDGQMSLTRGGLELMSAPKIPNADFPGFFHLATQTAAMPIGDSTEAMLDGTYLALCDLVDGTGLSPLGQSAFAQDLLDTVHRNVAAGSTS